MSAIIQIESSNATGNWAYVVRDNHNIRIVATGDIHLARKILKQINNVTNEIQSNDFTNAFERSK